MRRLRGQSGLSLVEVMVTLVVLSSGMMATLGLFARTGQATLTAQQKAAMVALAQRELERLRPLDYGSLGISGAVSPGAPALTGPAASEPLVGGGVVAPGPEPFSVRGVRGSVYRYVTWRPQSCPAVKGRVAERVAADLGIPVDQVAASLSDLCAGTEHTKRLTVVLVPELNPEDPSPPAPVRLSTVAVDPGSGVLAAGSHQGLRVHPGELAGAGSGQAGPAEQAYAGIAQQVHHLYDTPCSAGARRPVLAGHETHDTGIAGATCTGTRVPDLMGAAAPDGAATGPVHDYSTEVTRDAAGGLAMVRDEVAGACDTGFRYGGQEAARRLRSVHTWATPATTATAATAAENGRAVVSVWTRGASAASAGARLCATLWQQSTGAVLGSAEYAQAAWPAEPTQLSIAFDVAAATLPPGDRLLLTLRVPADSPGDVALYYDHPAHPSSLSVPMQAGAEIAG